MEMQLYRVISEMINNSVQHAKAKKITFSLIRQSNQITLHYIDDGIGFNLSQIKNGMGLKNINKRIELIGGNIQLITDSGKGVKYIATVTLD